ncbi:MAG: glucosidase [Cytophagaceae bacterium]|jgi:hypothetical protein|nr:glucosidase [Cytophagaceae bacterium]
MTKEEFEHSAERQRVAAASENNPWKRWGPYLTERQWGTVREDYSKEGASWEYVTHDMARSKAYRWGEEGIGGISDNKSILCFSWAFWNTKDSILKERLFGLSGNEGNHGEDVKELYYYLDSTPSHSYMKMLYKYPQAEFPYTALAEENRKRSKHDPEYELIDTGVFDDQRYFDLFIEYAKGDADDILIKLTIVNRGPEEAPLHVLPTLWFRNTWAPGLTDHKPDLQRQDDYTVFVSNGEKGSGFWYAEENAQWLFCDNETNYKRLIGFDNAHPYSKDGIHEFVVNGLEDCVNPAGHGTKASAWYQLLLKPGEERCLKMRLSSKHTTQPFFDFESIWNQRVEEANEFYGYIQQDVTNKHLRELQRQSYAGMMWSKQFYYFNIEQWLDGDPGNYPPPSERKQGRNAEWRHLSNSNVISMPDKWEYPWYAAWDLAFHTIPIARIDPDFAKRQLVIMVREYYMHPNGQIPAYEWNFGDVNPPVHAWATWRVYEIDKEMNGVSDLDFLERVFHKLLLNFTWWVNRKDAEGNNIFQGGFLGLDNIGVFDRSRPLPTGGTIQQADGTSWMAMYALNMLRIATELSTKSSTYQDLASKFFEHFLYIAGAMSNFSEDGISLWNEEDEFFYDVLQLPNGEKKPLKIRSMVGLIPLFAVEVLTPDLLEKLPDFKRRVEWVLSNKPKLANLISRWYESGYGETRLLSLLRGHRMKKLLSRMLDEAEFLSTYGIRALSKYHKDNPYLFKHGNDVFSVRYQPAESDTSLFGGNSNWRGPIWFPVNYMIIESLVKFHHYYGDSFKVEYPTGSGKEFTLKQIAGELSKRLMRIFIRNKDGKRPVFGDSPLLQQDQNFRDYILFYEYFHGDTGRGVGASHQTGWTGLIADLIHDFCDKN